MIKLNYGDSLGIEGMCTLSDASVDCILTDPPYLYLKNQKLDVPFDERLFFNECQRVLKDSGFIVLFGRGVSFYRWNTMLFEMGFVFKEEIVWDKRYCGSPVGTISRIHETISIFSKKNGVLQKKKIPYTEVKDIDLNSLLNDIKRIKSALNNTIDLDQLLSFINDKKVSYTSQRESTSYLTMSTKSCTRPPVGTLRSIVDGLNERSIISVARDQLYRIHPTQKPVRLLERLLNLTTEDGDLVIDPFAGSSSTGIACFNLNRNWIGWEKEHSFYTPSQKRLESVINQQKLF